MIYSIIFYFFRKIYSKLQNYRKNEKTQRRFLKSCGEKGKKLGLGM